MYLKYIMYQDLTVHSQFLFVVFFSFPCTSRLKIKFTKYFHMPRMYSENIFVIIDFIKFNVYILISLNIGQTQYLLYLVF